MLRPRCKGGQTSPANLSEVQVPYLGHRRWRTLGDHWICINYSWCVEQLLPGIRGLLVVRIQRELFNGIWFERSNVSEGLLYVRNPQALIHRNEKGRTSCGVATHHLCQGVQSTLEKLARKTMKGLSGSISWILILRPRRRFTDCAACGSVWKRPVNLQRKFTGTWVIRGTPISCAACMELRDKASFPLSGGF